MSFIIPSILLSIITLVLFFLGMTNIAGWIIWMVYGGISIFLFLFSFVRHKQILKGQPQSIGDVAGMAAYPFITSIMGIILITLLFVDISKLHILWLYPIVGFIFEFTTGKRAVDISDPYKKQWEDGAISFAAVYSINIKNLSAREAFVKTLEFGYKPPKLKELLEVMSPKEQRSIPTGKSLTKAVARLVGGKNNQEKINRYISILSVMGLKKVANKYVDDMRVVAPLLIDSECFEEIQLGDNFTFNAQNFNLDELIYSFLVIEFPRAIERLDKIEAMNMINFFLQKEKNTIDTRSKESIIIQHIKDVENL